MSEQEYEVGVVDSDGSDLDPQPTQQKRRVGRPNVTNDDIAAMRQEVRSKLWTPGLPAVPGSDRPDVWLPAPPGKKGTSAYKAWAMECFLELLRHGYTFSAAAEKLGYDYSWWTTTNAGDPAFAAEARAIRSGQVEAWEYPDITGMPFEEFVSEYFNIQLAAHQKQISAALCDPLARLVLVLGFPESGKSTLVSLWYVLYRLAQNPDARIALVAKSSPRAQDLLNRVKRYMTEEHLYDGCPRNLIADFNGWKPGHGGLEWSQDAIFIKHRKSGERDPSIQALGIGRQIYGTRLDYLILDDALVMDNQIGETLRERLDMWFTNEARSRAHRGQTVVNGTRLVPFDLYGQWKKSWKDNPLFRGVYIPAIAEENTDKERPTWPEYWKMEGYKDDAGGVEVYIPGLKDIRAEIAARDINRWRLVYQQEDVEETDSVFTMNHVMAARTLGANRSIGQVFEKELLILGIDPATTGRAAAVLMALDPETRIRTVVDMFVGSGLGGQGVRRELMYRFWDKYKDHGISYTVVETNFATTLLADEDLQHRAEVAGTVLRDHKTIGRGSKRGSKWDAEYGIGAMQSLFTGGLICFPSKTPGDVAFLRPLTDDMLTFPWSDQQDALIALWVAEGEAKIAQPHDRLSPTEYMQRRGVPPGIIERAKRSMNVPRQPWSSAD